jgi:hypothetical protein
VTSSVYLSNVADWAHPFIKALEIANLQQIEDQTVLIAPATITLGPT